VYLPKWPLQRLGQERPELRGKPVVLVDSQAGRGPQVVLCSAEAGRAGVRPGMPLAEALAALPRLCTVEADPQRDVKWLRQLASWAERYCPAVALEEGSDPQCLLLDITGCADCFHGEDELLRRAIEDLRAEGWTARVAIADTVGAAWGLAHHGRTPCLVPPGQTETVLSPLPAAALRLPAESLEMLARLGIESVGQLLGLPRGQLATRFGPALLQRLDQALGRRPEPIVPHRTVPPVQAALRLEWPTDRWQILNVVLDQLTENIHTLLKNFDQGARQIECWLSFESAAPLRVEVNLVRPSHSLTYLRMLLRTRLEQVQVPEPVRELLLYVSRSEALSARQPELMETDSPYDPEELCVLIDRLGSRLGPEAVTRAALVPDAQPEYACRFEPLAQTDGERAGGKKAKRPEDLPRLVQRPLRLLPSPALLQVVSVVPDGPPVQFQWAGVSYRVSAAWGPERIETGWWRDRDVRRDYYVVVTHLGNRFWLFRRRDDGRWFLHGCFD